MTAFGGGTDNIAVLDGDATATTPNAQTFQMDAIFWIETVQHTIHVPIFKPGSAPLELPDASHAVPGRPARTFMVIPPHEITAPRTITFTTTQIQCRLPPGTDPRAVGTGRGNRFRLGGEGHPAPSH